MSVQEKVMPLVHLHGIAHFSQGVMDEVQASIVVDHLVFLNPSEKTEVHVSRVVIDGSAAADSPYDWNVFCPTIVEMAFSKRVLMLSYYDRFRVYPQTQRLMLEACEIPLLICQIQGTRREAQDVDLHGIHGSAKVKLYEISDGKKPQNK